MLPQDLWADATAEQDERRQHDPWDDVLANVEGVLYPATDDNSIELEWVKVQELLIRLSIENDRASPEIYKRLKGAMKRLGWTKGKHYFNGKKQERGYWRKTQDT